MHIESRLIHRSLVHYAASCCLARFTQQLNSTSRPLIKNKYGLTAAQFAYTSLLLLNGVYCILTFIHVVPYFLEHNNLTHDAPVKKELSEVMQNPAMMNNHGSWFHASWFSILHTCMQESHLGISVF